MNEMSHIHISLNVMDKVVSTFTIRIPITSIYDDGQFMICDFCSSSRRSWIKTERR